VTVRKLSISVKLYATFALMAIGALAMDMAFDADAPVWVTGPIGAAIAGTLVFAVMSARGVSQPIAELARVTDKIAGGEPNATVPYCDRQDEIGALARSIRVFQQAMLSNAELNRTVSSDAEARAQRQSAVAAEIARFSSDIETTLVELGGISEQMLTASSALDRQDRARRGRLVGSLRERPRHRLGGR